MHNERAVISGEGKSLRRIITFITSSNCPVEVCIDHSGQNFRGRKRAKVTFEYCILKICTYSLKYSDIFSVEKCEADRAKFFAFFFLSKVGCHLRKFTFVGCAAVPPRMK